MHWVLQQMATESKGITSELIALRSGKRLVRNCQSQPLIGKTIPLKVLSTFDKDFEKVWPINVSLRQCLHVRSLGLAQRIGLTRFTLSLFLVNFLLFTPKGEWQRERWQKTMYLEIQQISTRDKCDKYNQIIQASLKGSPRRQSHHALGSLIKSNCYWNLEGARKISKQEHSKPSGGWFISELGGFGLSNEGDIIMISVGPSQITAGALSVNKSCISVGFIVLLGNSFNQSSQSLSLSAGKKTEGHQSQR